MATLDAIKVEQTLAVARLDFATAIAMLQVSAKTRGVEQHQFEFDLKIAQERGEKLGRLLRHAGPDQAGRFERAAKKVLREACRNCEERRTQSEGDGC